MTVDNDYADNLKHELLTEMADSFFSRRRNLEDRLESFTTLRQTVARQGALVLARWRAFRDLLLAGPEADRFLANQGFDLTALAAFPPLVGASFQARRPLALTASGRYTKTVLAFYDDLQNELEHYNEGSYIPDSRDPRRMRRIPGYTHLLSVAQSLNEEIAAVNSCQSPTDMLQFTKSLDPIRQQQEHACGGISMGDTCRLDQELAFAPLDLDTLEAPKLPTPPLLEHIEDDLAALTKRLYDANPAAASAAMAALAK
ncbi:MAG: hypothetical protein AB9872_13715 [Solidesulfovibrio sp.]